jgi:hypothetical protein
MDDVGRLGALGQPPVLGDDPAGPRPSVDWRLDDLELGGEVRVGGGEPFHAIQHRSELVLVLRQSDELAHEVLLRAPNIARYAPQQVHRNIHDAQAQPPNANL